MKLYKKLTTHLVDSTAVAASMSPLMAAIEVGAAKMPNSTAINARLLGAALLYAGFGSIYSGGRDTSKRLFTITRETNEIKKYVHDGLFTFAYTALLQPPFYYVAGSRDVREIVIGTLGAAAVATVFGPVFGYSIDAYRDLTGIEESERLAGFVKNQTPTTKKYIASLLTAGSVAALAGIYTLNK